MFAAALLAAGLSCALYAQQQPAPTPQPAPPNQPNNPTQPRQPNVITPQPQPTQGQTINIRGRIITGVVTEFPITEVRFETDGGQPMGFAYADSNGEFHFQQSGLSVDQTLYVLIKLDGYKPYRERLNNGLGGFDTFLTIFLERENTTVVKGGAAVVDLKQLRAKVPGKAVDEYEKALKESSKGNRDKAVEGFQRAVKLAPDFYEAQQSLGIQLLSMQKYDEAETALVKASSLSPKAADPLINLGTLHYQRGEAQGDAGHAEEAAAAFHKAAEILEEATRRSPLSASAHSYLGAAQYKLGSYEVAEATLKHALDLDENQANARLMLLNVYTKSARFDLALEQAKLFIEKNPKAPQRPAVETIKQQIEKALAK
jgi:tetratricopeptide (TPR) repeat protein